MHTVINVKHARTDISSRDEDENNDMLLHNISNERSFVALSLKRPLGTTCACGTDTLFPGRLTTFSDNVLSHGQPIPDRNLTNNILTINGVGGVTTQYITRGGGGTMIALCASYSFCYRVVSESRQISPLQLSSSLSSNTQESDRAHQEQNTKFTP